MTIDHNVSLDMSDLADILSDKFDSTIDADKIVINDYKVPEPPENTDGVGEEKAVEVAGLVKKSNIVKVLKEGLKAANAEDKFPKNAKSLCEDAMEDTVGEFNNKDATLFAEIINAPGFTKFALLWQKYQSRIQNKL